MGKQKFLRRTYHHLGDLLDDFHYIWRNRRLLHQTMRSIIPPGFRERLMLVVTEVNGCRYCSYYHASSALAVGVTQQELVELLKGAIPAGTPPEELPALVYAQHWAETGTSPDSKAVRRLMVTYGQQKVNAIHIILRMIRLGNLLGNTGDYILYRLTFGMLGLRRDETRYATV